MNKQMTKQDLGKSGLEVSSIGLGFMDMSDFYGPRDDKQSTPTLLQAVDIGVNFWDTSDIYDPGKNELLRGKVIKESGRQDEIVLVTKLGIKRDKIPDKLLASMDALNTCTKVVTQAYRGWELIKSTFTTTSSRYFRTIEKTDGAMAELVRQGG